MLVLYNASSIYALKYNVTLMRSARRGTTTTRFHYPSLGSPSPPRSSLRRGLFLTGHFNVISNVHATRIRRP